MITPNTTTPRPGATAGGSIGGSAADRTALGLLAVLSTALQVPFLRRGISFYDEGSILAIADALHRGELLYRDRATPTAPLTYELMGVLFDLFGPHLLVGRILQAVVFVLCVLAVYAILRHFMGVRAACLGALALLPLKTLAFPFWTVVNYSQVAMLFWLATTAALLQYLRLWPLALGDGCRMRDWADRGHEAEPRRGPGGGVCRHPGPRRRAARRRPPALPGRGYRRARWVQSVAGRRLRRILRALWHARRGRSHGPSSGCCTSCSRTACRCRGATAIRTPATSSLPTSQRHWRICRGKDG